MLQNGDSKFGKNPSSTPKDKELLAVCDNVTGAKNYLRREPLHEFVHGTTFCIEVPRCW